MQEAYATVRKDLGHYLRRQKEIYDVKAHGHPYKKGDMVWLHNAAVAKGKSRKFHKPWAGPYRVVKQISEATYHIQLVSNLRKRVVVHFDRLKPFKGHVSRMDIGDPRDPESRTEVDTSLDQTCHPVVGEHLELCEDDDDDPMPPQAQPTRRYPSRVHRPPARFGDPVLS